MNLIEALKTGLPLRRPTDKFWEGCRTGYLDCEFVKALLLGDTKWAHFTLSASDLIADDWQVQSTKCIDCGNMAEERKGVSRCAVCQNKRDLS